MCRSQTNQFLEQEAEKLEDYMETHLDYTIDKHDNVILFECPLCSSYKPVAYIFVCGCSHVGLMCCNCLNWLDHIEVNFFCTCYGDTNYDLLPLSKERVLPLLQQKRLYLLRSDSDDS